MYQIMAGVNRLSFTVFFFILIFSFTNCSKLSVPRILLPIFTDISVNFTLEVTDGGCYKWSTSRLDLLRITPIGYDESKQCSDRVIVSSISKEPVRNTAMILATEIHTEQLLRCDVILDVIHTLNVVTTTRELFMEEAPEAFEVRAYDDQGNEFSSMEGIPFHWTLNVHCPEVGKCPGNVLKFITFKESPYETPESIKHFEDIGLQGHTILIEGSKTGIAKVAVKLPQPEYRQIEACEVLLTVVANIIIFPPELNILPNGDAKFRVYRMYQNKLEEIEMPNKQYYFVVEDEKVGSIKQNGDVTGLKIGRTKVVINDRNVDPSDSSVKLPSAMLVVVMPAYLTISILPHLNWAILVQDSHTIVVEAYSSQDHKILLSDGVGMKIDIDTKYFRVSDQSKNGTWIQGFGIDAGFSPVHATLESVNGKMLDGRVTAHADLFIYPRIVLTPSEINLPWDPKVKPEYVEKLRVTGGDGHFLWSSTNSDIAVVSQAGIVRTKNIGEVDITASMARNHNNRKSAKVHLLPPGRLEIVEYIMEAETNQPIHLQIALFGKRSPTSNDEVPFTQCDTIPFKVYSSDENFYYNETKSTQPVGMACTTISIVGRVVGSSKITVSYEYQDTLLEDTVTVAAYKPLTLSFDRKAETVLAVGTTRNFIAQGGPRPTMGHLSEHKRSLVSSDPQIVEAVDITPKLLCKSGCASDIFAIQVRCLSIGDAVVEIAVSNTPTLTSCSGSTSLLKINVFCSRPRVIRLKPEVDIVDLQSCPMDLNSQKIAIQNYKRIPIHVAVKDDSGRTFDNITSLILTWNLVPKDLAILDGFKEVTRSEYGIELPGGFVQEIEPIGLNGNMEIVVSALGYWNEMLFNQRINPSTAKIYEKGSKLCVGSDCPPMSPQLYAALTFFLVGDVEVTSNAFVMYNHPKNIQFVDLKQGSGFYEIGLSSKEIAHVKYNEGSRELEISPKATGELKISVSDICLASKPTSITVNVVSVKSIKVDMSHKVEIGKCVKAIVKLYDDADVLLQLPDLSLLELRTNVESKIISVKQTLECSEEPCQEEDRWGVGEIHFIITGLELGETKLSFATGQGSREAISNPITVQVFKPIRLLPRNVTLIVSSLLQLTHEGGPSDANIVYSIVNSKIGSVEVNGLIEAKQIGMTQVVVHATGINPNSGQRVLYSKDSIQLNVVKLVGVKIGTPLTRFKVGKSVPFWVYGVPEEITPLILGTTKQKISYEWEVLPDEVAKVCTVFGCSGIKYSKHQQVAVHLTGLTPGRAKLQLNVTIDRSITGGYGEGVTKFTTSIDFEIYDPLIVTQFQDQKILLSPYSSFQISTNKDRTGHVAYAVQQDVTNTALISDGNTMGWSKSVITVTSNGLIRSFGVYGLAVVVVTSEEEFGLKQTQIVVIEVKPVHYMLTKVKTQIKISKELSIGVIPRGADLELLITYHDNTGDEFMGVLNDLKVRTSRNDLVKIQRGNDNVTLLAGVHKAGDTVLKIWDDAFPMRVLEYIKFHVGDIIKPSSPRVTSGDVVCFSSPLLSQSGTPGSWGSGRPYMEGGENDGVMVALRPRERPTTISYVVSPEFQTTTDIQVLPIERIRFLTENTCGCVSNSFRLSVEEIPLVLLGKNDGLEKVSNLVSYGKCNPLESSAIKNFPFSCEIEFTNNDITMDVADIFSVEPNFNFKTGQYSCKIITVSSPELNTSLFSSNITLKVISGAVKAEHRLTFVPGVFIDNSDLYISNGRYKGYVNIHGIPQILSKLSVIPVDTDYLNVYPTISSASDTFRRFEVVLRNAKWKQAVGGEDKMAIIVDSKATKQRMKIDVKTDYTGDGEGIDNDQLEWGSPLMGTLWNFRKTFAVCASLLGVLLASIYSYSNYIQPVINVYVQPQQSPVENIGDTSNTPTKRCSPGNCVSYGPYGSYGPSSSPSRLNGSMAGHDVSGYGQLTSNIISPRRSGYSPQNSYASTGSSPTGRPNSGLTYEEIRNRHLNR